MRTVIQIALTLVACLQVDPDVLRREAQLLREAMEKARWSIEKLSLHLGVDKSQLRREIDGETNLTKKRELTLPLEIRQWYAALTLQEIGLPDRLVRAEPLLALRRHSKQNSEVA